MELTEDVYPLVIDNGSATIKAGWARDASIRSIVPSVVGRPNISHEAPAADLKDSYVGEKAQEMRELLNLSHPIRGGVINNWDDMELLWHHILFDELRVCPEDHPVLLTEKPLQARKARERSMEIMFEKYEVPAFFLINQLSLSLLCSGRSSGLVVDFGENTTLSASIYEGHILPHTVQKLDLGGQEVTEYLRRDVEQKRGVSLKINGKNDPAKDIKEDHSFVSLDLDEEKINESCSVLDRSVELRDGEEMTINSERYRCNEIFFKPPLIDSRSPGIHELVFSSINKTDAEIIDQVSSNIVLSGGPSITKGLAERLGKEIEILVGDKRNVKIVAPPERKYSSWMGGALWACDPRNAPAWITKELYEEAGSGVVHRFCF